MIQSSGTSPTFATQFPTVLEVNLTSFLSSISLRNNWKKQNSNHAEKSFESVFKEFGEGF